jgi:haloacetate dehalogenase
MYERTSMGFARDYYHWFFLIQPSPLPERLINHDPAWFLRAKLGGFGRTSVGSFDPRALAEYQRCFTEPAIHAMCEDYRAAATIDLEHDRADADARIQCPVRVLWGEHGIVHRYFEPVADWSAKSATPATGTTVPAGHYIPEEVPDVLIAEMLRFFGAERPIATKRTHAH